MSNIPKTKLAPCPFCGNDVRYEEDFGSIICDSEKSCGFYYECPEGLTDEIIKCWNRRAK